MGSFDYLQSLDHKYSIFCGAPAHLIGKTGYVKIALPFLRFFPILPVFCE
jgi:hypothetical protein